MKKTDLHTHCSVTICIARDILTYDGPDRKREGMDRFEVQKESEEQQNPQKLTVANHTSK